MKKDHFTTSSIAAILVLLHSQSTTNTDIDLVFECYIERGVIMAQRNICINTADWFKAESKDAQRFWPRTTSSFAIHEVWTRTLVAPLDSLSHDPAAVARLDY